jgi:long-chain acyl-CoA synthetase
MSSLSSLFPHLDRERVDELALDDLTRTRTWTELADRATRVGRFLRHDLGLAAGEHAAIVMGNRVEYLEVLLGALCSGVWVAAVNWHLTAPEIAFILEDAAARLVVVDPEHEAVTREAIALTGAETPVVVAGDGLDRVLADASDEQFDDDDPAGGTMFYTSGTTGRPKGVKRAAAATLRARVLSQAAAGRNLGLDGAGPHLVTGPLYHAAPVGFALMDLFAGAPTVVMPRWDEAQFLDLVDDRGVRNTHLVPTMFVRLLRLDDERRAAFDGSSLHTVLHGAAPVAPSVKRRMIDWWGPVLVEYWGASEGGVVTLVGSEEWLAHPGTVGRATRTHEVFATDADGNRLAAGETGTLWCRNTVIDQVFEYHNDPAKTAAAFAGPGTYSIGDVGRVEADGYVYLSDRAANMIISGGVNIYPAEIEHALAEHPAVSDIAVFGIPDDEWGEQVKAAIELAPGMAPSDELTAEILAFARERVAGYKVPRSIDYEAELPRHPNGKLYTRLLRDRYWPDADRSI